jgi:hypothetical protein
MTFTFYEARLRLGDPAVHLQSGVAVESASQRPTVYIPWLQWPCTNRQ